MTRDVPITMLNFGLCCNMKKIQVFQTIFHTVCRPIVLHNHFSCRPSTSQRPCNVNKSLICLQVVFTLKLNMNSICAGLPQNCFLSEQDDRQNEMHVP